MPHSQDAPLALKSVTLSTAFVNPLSQSVTITGTWPQDLTLAANKGGSMYKISFSGTSLGQLYSMIDRMRVDANVFMLPGNRASQGDFASTGYFFFVNVADLTGGLSYDFYSDASRLAIYWWHADKLVAWVR